MNTSSGGWIIAAAAAAAAVFVIDVLLPLGYAVPMLYVLPIVLTWMLPGRQSTVLVFGGALLLTWMGVSLSPGELTPEALVNRVLTTALLFAIAWLLIAHKESARKIAEVQQAMDTSEERLRLAQSAEGFGTFDWDIPAQRVVWSAETERMWGLPIGGFEGTYEHWRRLVHPDDVAEAERIARLSLEHPDVSYAYDHRIIRPDGAVRWIHAKATTLRDAAGRAVRMVGVNLDITERKQADEALRQLAEQAKADLKAMTMLNELGMLSSRADTLSPVLEQIVDAAIAISGSDFGNIQLLDPESGDLKIVAQRGFPDWWVEFWNEVPKGQGACGVALECGQRVIINDVKHSPIYTDETARDTLLQVGVHSVVSTPLVNRSGKLVGMFSTHYKTSIRPDKHTLAQLDLLARQAADVIERAQAESALATAELHYRTIFQEAGVGVAQIDSRTGQFLQVNRKYCEIVGLTEGEMLATTFMHITHPDDLAEDLASMERLRNGELSVFTMEKRYVKKGGSIVWVSLNVAPLWQAGDMPTQHIAVVQDITERKQAEQSLQKTQDLLQETEKIGHVGGWEFDIDTRKQTWTDEVYRIHQVSRDFEPTVDNGIAFYAPESKSIIEYMVQRAIEAGEPFDVELEFLTAKGNRRWVHAIGKRDVEGRRLQGFFQDITERKQVEEALRRMNETLEERVAERTAALREAEERFRGIFEHAAEGIAITDLEGRFVQCNAAYAAIVGYNKDELTGLQFESLLHPDDRLQDMELVRQLLSGDVPSFEIENRYLMKSGSSAWVHTYASILRNDQGVPTHLMALVTDITKRKRMEDELRRSEAFTRSVVDNLPLMVFVKDAEDLRFRSLNKVGEQLLGYSERDMRGKNDYDFFPKEEADFFTAKDKEVLASGQLLDIFEEPIKARDGTLRFLHTKKIPIRDHKGHPQYLLGISEDITERKRAEEELAWQHTKLEDMTAKLLTAQERERKRIAGELHDDFTQRIATVAIDLQSIRSVMPGFEESVVARVHQAGKMAEQITTDLQRLAHQLHPSLLEHVGLEAAVQEHVEEFEVRTGLKTKVQVRNLPTALSLDRATSLYRVLQESLQNVRKHANATYVVIRLLGSTRGVGLCVHDDGRGFEQDRQTSNGRKGLGLISMEERVGVLQGTFRIKTKPGDGTEIHAWVPLGQCQVSPNGGAQA